MYKLIKHIVKNPKKINKLHNEMVKVSFNEDDFTVEGLCKIKQALREISGDPDIDFYTCRIEVPFKGFDYNTWLEEKTWEWEE
jgi:hypothetical protein